MAKSHQMAAKPERTVPIRLEVLSSRRVSPSFIRVTLGGAEVDRYTHRGYDQWFRLYLPPEGATELVLPNRDGWGGYAQLLTTKKDLRPTMRNYTVRAYRAATAGRGAEIDVDFVLHASPESGEVEGIAARWALNCRPGDPVGILDEGHGYDPAPSAAWHLLVADETALPAVAGICATLPADARGLAIIEIPDAADVQEFPVPAGVEVRWLPRSEAAAGHDAHAHPRIGALAYAEAVRAELPDLGSGDVSMHAGVNGESALATSLRRHLVTDNGWPKSAVNFCGYWRLPKGSDPVDVDVAASVSVSSH